MMKDSKEISNKIENKDKKQYIALICSNSTKIKLYLHRVGLDTFDINIFSREHIEMCNIVPFKTISEYFQRMTENTIGGCIGYGIVQIKFIRKLLKLDE